MIIDSKKYNGPCECGRNHEMVTKAVVIEPGCLKDLDKYLEEYGIFGKRCALYDENTFAATAGCHVNAQQIIVLDPSGLHANEVATAKVLEQLESDVEIIIAVGSGTIHDTARFCAHERGIRFVSCPTGASVDGFCSTVAAMTWYGFKKTMPAVAPELVVADIDIIKKAPAELVRSGVGDIAAKYVALADWRISNIVTGEYLCENIFSIMQEALEKVMDSIPDIITGRDEAYASVTYALIMSGLAMQMMGNSRPASGAEHHFSHLIEMEPEKLNVKFSAMHGEKTGVGTIFVLKEYKRLGMIEDIAPFVTGYSPIDTTDMTDFMGEKLAPSIAEENENCVLAAVDKTKLVENWAEVRSIIDELPTGEEIYEKLNNLGAKCTADSIGVSEADVPKILYYSPMVRNRLTLMRIKHMTNIVTF